MPDCDVCIGGTYDGDLAEFYDSAVVTANKPHECCECRSLIEPGQKYERATGKWEGEISRFSTCLLCQEIRKVFTCGENWTFETLWDEMTEIAFPKLTHHSPCFRELSVAAKKYVLDRWRQWKGLES